MEQTDAPRNDRPANDNGLDWDLTDGPGGGVWLVDQREGGKMTLLGSEEDVSSYLAEWLALRDFGERG